MTLLSNKNFISPASTLIIIVALFSLTFTVVSAQALPTELTPEQQALLDERQEADKAKNAADEDALTTAQMEDIADNTVCESQYQGSFQASEGGAKSGGSGSPVFEIGSLLEISSNILGTLQGMGETVLTNIDTNTGQNNEMTQIVCDYLKAVKRISKHFEDKTFMFDPAARREAARDTEKYKFQVLNLVKKGHITGVDESGTETTGKLFPENTQEYINKAVEEQVMVQLDDLQKIADNNPDNPYLKNTINSLRYQESLNLESKLKNSLTQEKIDQAFDSSSGLSAQESDDIFLEIFNPESNANPYTQLLTADATLQQAKYNAAQNVRDELLAGNGFLNNRECAETTTGVGTGGAIYCRRWVTITPGSIISGGTLAAINSRLQQYEQAGTEGELTEYVPSVNELTNMSPDGDTSTGGYGSFDDYDGDGVSNWQDDDKDGDGVEDSNDITPYLNDGARRPVSVTFQASRPVEIAGSSLLSSTLTWNSSSTYCKADNNWISADSAAPRTITAVKSAGSQLAESDSLEVKVPLNFEAKLIRIRGGVTTEYLAATSSDNTRLGMLATLLVPGGQDGTMVGDKFQLSVKPFDANNTVEVTVPATATGSTAVLNLFRNALTTRLKNYVFGYQTNTGKITVLAEPSYQISCISVTGLTTSTTTKKVKIQK